MESRQAIVLGLSVVAGAVLFFLVFAAVFNGLWPLLILFTVSYGIAAAVAVRLGRTRPLLVASALVCPAVPWLTWLFPASIPEAGLLRASLWPASVAVMFLLAWLGGTLATRFASR